MLVSYSLLGVKETSSVAIVNKKKIDCILQFTSRNT